MVGIVPWVSQRATAGGEAGVGGCGGGLCGCAWQRWRELWDSRASGTWGSQRSSTDFYREAQNVSCPNIIMEDNNNHPLVWRTKLEKLLTGSLQFGPAAETRAGSCWGRRFERQLTHPGRGATASWGRDNSYYSMFFQRRWKQWWRRVSCGRPC